MAVFTEISINDAERLFSKLGKINHITGIEEGVENTNYIIEFVNRQKFIFTIFEKRTKNDDLPYFNSVMSKFYNDGVPCPTCVNIDGKEIFKIKGKYSCLYKFLEGRPTQDLNNQKLKSLSNILTKLHKIGKSSNLYRENNMLIPSWIYILNKFKNHSNYQYKEELKYVSKLINDLQDLFPKNLTKSIIHADIFPDNVFYNNNEVSGIIDFFFTCNDTKIYDLAILINSWFVIGEFNEDNCINFLKFYLEKNKLTNEEKNYFNFYLKVSAIRFFLTRLHDMHFNLNGQVKHKDPLEFFNIIKFHYNNNLQDLI